MDRFILLSFCKPYRTYVFALVIMVSQWAMGMDFRIRLVEVPHDGFCFYHAMAKALSDRTEIAVRPGGRENGGASLFQHLSTFLSSASAATHPMLEAHLNDAVVGSSIESLASRLETTPPTLTDRDSWAGLPELVAVVHMLNQPVLVWHINQNQQVDEHSLLITPDSVLPVSSIDDASGLMIPAIQLVHLGNEWWLLDARDSLESWNTGWEAYRRQVSGVLHEQIAADHTGSYEGYPDDKAASEGWVYLTDDKPPEDLLILSFSSITALQEMVFETSWPSLMRAYIDMKVALRLAADEHDTTLDPDYQWSNARYDRLIRTTDRVSRILALPVTFRVLGDSMDDALYFAGERQADFMLSLLPTRRSVWDTLARFKPVVDWFARNMVGLSFYAFYASLLASSQASDVSFLRRFDFSQRSFNPLPSGQQHPADITVTQGRVEIPFDAANPLHHILFSLYVSATTYEMANQCLKVSLRMSDRDRLSDRDLAESLNWQHGPSIRKAVKRQIKEYQAVLLRIHSVIHALGLRYYPQYWRSDHYQAITICDGKTVTFHSDSFQPREGWLHMQPPFPDDDDDEPPGNRAPDK